MDYFEDETKRFEGIDLGSDTIWRTYFHYIVTLYNKLSY